MKEIQDTEIKKRCTTFFSDASLCLGVWGPLYDFPGDKGSAASLSDVYKSQGIKGLSGLNGRYLIALKDRIKRKFYLVNDRHGFKRCFYRAEGPFGFSTEFSELAGQAASAVDEQSIADLLLLGFVPGERTLRRDIRLLPPASIMTFDDKRASIERYWDFSFQSDRAVPFEDVCLKEFYGRVVDAVGKIVRGREKIILPLSGGLDSRTVAGALYSSGFKGKVESLSYGQPDSYDVVYGRKIARVLGYPHRFIPVPPDYLSRYAESFVLRTDGTINCLNAHTMLLYDVFGQGHGAGLLTGFLGDVVTGTNFSPRYVGESVEETIFRTFEVPQGHLEWLKNSLRNDLFERIMDVTIPSLKKKYEAAGCEDPLYSAHYLTLSERQRRYVAFNIYSYEGLGEVLSPFTDNALMDFTLALPKQFLKDQGLYKKMIVKYMPKVASVEYGRTQLPLNVSWLRKGLHWRWERLNRHVFVRSTLGRRYSRMNDNYLNADEAIRASGPFIRGILKDNAFLSARMSMDKVNATVESHLNGEANEYYKITSVLTLAIWHRLFEETGMGRVSGGTGL